MDHNRFSHSHVHLSGVSIGHNVYRKGFLDGDTARMPRRHWWVGVSTMRWFYQRRQSQKATADIERKWYVMWIDVVWSMVQLKWHMTYGSKSWHMMTYDDINQMTYDINVISGLLWRVCLWRGSCHCEAEATCPKLSDGPGFLTVVLLRSAKVCWKITEEWFMTPPSAKLT